jgi:hypothetical protein
MAKSAQDRPGFGPVNFQEPIGGNEPCLVHKDGTANGRASPSNPKILCDTGKICAFGTCIGATPIDDVHAKVFPPDTRDEDIPQTPPSGTTQGQSVVNTHRWKVEDIPEAQSEPAGASAVQNKLAVWVHFTNDGADTWTLGIKSFIGLTSDKTFCESLHR